MPASSQSPQRRHRARKSLAASRWLSCQCVENRENFDPEVEEATMRYCFHVGDGVTIVHAQGTKRMHENKTKLAGKIQAPQEKAYSY